MGMAAASTTSGRLTLAAPGYVFTIARVARMLGEDEEKLCDIAIDMEPKDGCLSILNVDDDAAIIAFTTFGVENLKDILAELKS